jgi:hypothetical protein
MYNIHQKYFTKLHYYTENHPVNTQTGKYPKKKKGEGSIAYRKPPSPFFYFKQPFFGS